MAEFRFDDGVVGYFEPGPGDKKYRVTLYQNGQRWKTVTFGDRRYEHFEDKTPLMLYSYQNHYDENRRRSYRARHGAQGYQNEKYSPAWFSWWFLW